MLNSLHSFPTQRIQKGVSLLEALVAIVIASIGILGILGTQMRTLADAQTGTRRAQAIRLIEDLSERTKVNPNALGILSNYATAWDGASAPANYTSVCKGSACDAAALATDDIKIWKQLVRKTLPLGDAAVFLAADETTAANRRQLGVMVSWKENEASAESAFRAPMLTASTGGAGVSCPADRICHLQYIQPSSRCAPYSLGGASNPQTFCPN